jgi:hypothetical protein
MIGAAAVSVLIAFAARLHVLDAGGALGVAPMVAGAFFLAWAPPPAKRLRTVGWTLIAVSAAAAGITIAALRR